MESNGRCGVAPARCVIAMATARQPVRGPNSVGSSCRVVCGVAAVLWRRVPHSGGLLGVVRSASVGSLSTQGCVCSFGDYMGGLLVVAASDGVVEVRVDVPIRQGSVVLQICVVRLASMSQSDRSELSCCWCALMSQSNPLIWCVFFLFLLLPGYGLPEI